MSDAAFWLCCAVCVPAALMVVMRRNPVHSALSLLVCFLAFAVIYLTLDAPFLAAIHVVVYTGAILVLFLFVIMLLNLRGPELGGELKPSARGIAAALSAAMALGTALLLLRLEGQQAELPGDFGGAKEVGRALFGGYVLHFELVGLLLLVSMIGAMVLAKKRVKDND